MVYGAIGPEPEPSDFPIGYSSDFIRGDYPGLSFLSSPIKGGLSGGPPSIFPYVSGPFLLRLRQILVSFN